MAGILAIGVIKVQRLLPEAVVGEGIRLSSSRRWIKTAVSRVVEGLGSIVHSRQFESRNDGL